MVLITLPILRFLKNCQIYEIRSKSHEKSSTSDFSQALGVCELEALEPRPHAKGEPLLKDIIEQTSKFMLAL